MTEEIPGPEIKTGEDVKQEGQSGPSGFIGALWVMTP